MAEYDPESAATSVPPPGRCVLVVEDEVLILMMLEDMLADAGFEPVTAATLRDGMALLDTQHFDAAILDMNLNGVSVSPLADALLVRGVPFAFSTGGSDPDTLKGRSERPVLAKPYRDCELVDLLAALVDRKAARGPRPSGPRFASRAARSPAPTHHRRGGCTVATGRPAPPGSSIPPS